jgi:DNA-directed RNA polymerase II subunit RPB2
VVFLKRYLLPHLGTESDE